VYTNFLRGFLAIYALSQEDVLVAIALGLGTANRFNPYSQITWLGGMVAITLFLNDP
jgi:hypothetical protein